MFRHQHRLPEPARCCTDRESWHGMMTRPCVTDDSPAHIAGWNSSPNRSSRRFAPDVSSDALVSGLRHELRNESVNVHLVVLVVRPRADRTFDDLAYRVDGFAFPNADPELVITGRRMDRQCNVRREPGFERLRLGRLKAGGIVNSVDDCYEHGVAVLLVGIVARPVSRPGVTAPHHFGDGSQSPMLVRSGVDGQR